MPENSQTGHKQNLGRMIRDARKAKGYTQSELASLLGITKSTVSGLELDRTVPSVRTLERIASVLGLTLKISLE